MLQGSDIWQWGRCKIAPRKGFNWMPRLWLAGAPHLKDHGSIGWSKQGASSRTERQKKSGMKTNQWGASDRFEDWMTTMAIRGGQKSVWMFCCPALSGFQSLHQVKARVGEQPLTSAHSPANPQSLQPSSGKDLILSVAIRIHYPMFVNSKISRPHKKIRRLKQCSLACADFSLHLSHSWERPNPVSCNLDSLPNKRFKLILFCALDILLLINHQKI